jgi:ketosteroid isomerase-like protein
MLRLTSLAVSVSLACVASPRNAATQVATAEIRTTIARYDEAWNRRDSGAVGALLAPDYVYFTSTGGVNRRADALTFLTSATYVLAAAQRSDVEVLHATTDLAIVSSRWQGHGTWQGKPFNDDQRCGLVLRRAAGSWHILAEHCTQIVSQ